MAASGTHRCAGGSGRTKGYEREQPTSLQARRLPDLADTPSSMERGARVELAARGWSEGGTAPCAAPPYCQPAATTRLVAAAVDLHVGPRSQDGVEAVDRQEKGVLVVVGRTPRPAA